MARRSSLDAFPELRLEEPLVRRSSLDAFPELRLEEQRQGGDEGPSRSVRPSKRSTITGLLGAFPELRLEELRLQTSDRSARVAASAMLFAVFADAINLQCCYANYPLMVTPGASADSFPHTEPFGIVTAQYVLQCGISIGLVLSNFFFGWVAARIGSRRAALVLMGGSVAFTIVKYLVRRSYWGFVAASFVNALFGSSVAVGNGYMCLLFRSDQQKVDLWIGYLMATMVASRSLGGLFALMAPSNLFFPLIPAAAISVIGFVVVYKFVLQLDVTGDGGGKESGEGSPDRLDKCALANIVSGALLDNIGSLCIIPLAFSPAMYEVFFLNFMVEGETPVMSENAYRWLISMIALVAVPSALLSPVFYQKLGIALTCIVGNLLTSLTGIAIIFVAAMPPTQSSFALFASIVYIAFPITLTSTLSTGPMLDRVAPVEKKTFMQGLNSALSDFANGIFPVLFGWISDTYGFTLALWICVGFGLLAVLVNLPLVFHPLLARKKARGPGEDNDTVDTIDEDEVQKLLDNAEYVPLKVQFQVNHGKADRGEPYLRTRTGKYSRENAGAFELSYEDVTFVRDAFENRLVAIHNDPQLKEAYLREIKKRSPDSESMDSMKLELGEWFADWLHHNGYLTGLSNVQFMMGLIMHAFPRIIDGKELTVDNAEEALLKANRVFNRLAENIEAGRKRGELKRLKIQ